MGFVLSRPLILVSHYWAAYQSFKALESTSSEESKQWLTYWIVVASMQGVEYLVDNVLSWMPVYGFTKLFFFVWLQHPRTRGALQIYNAFLLPFLRSNQIKIDESIGQIEVQVGRRISEVSEFVVHEIQKELSQFDQANTLSKPYSLPSPLKNKEVKR